MILFFAEKYHILPMDVEQRPFASLCESFDDILMDNERVDMTKKHTTKTYTQNGRTIRQVAVGDF